MSARPNSKPPPSQDEPWPITEITVAGYKSLRHERSVEVRPLTILAGANSSGKSSMIEPLLLLKQTLEASYDPGPLLLSGPHLTFTEASQLLSRVDPRGQVDGFHVGLRIGTDYHITTYFKQQEDSGLDVCRTTIATSRGERTLAPEMSNEELQREVFGEVWEEFADTVLRVECRRGFLTPARLQRSQMDESWIGGHWTLTRPAEEAIQRMIHVSALRGHSERRYPRTAVNATFQGEFGVYVASIIARWQIGDKSGKLKRVNSDLKQLGLTWKVSAKRMGDSEIELHVGRLPSAGGSTRDDLVHIADVGVGVSQVLPVIVALHVATPHHLVYLEQPEIHLHPRAQVALASVLARAVNRGVRVVVETHSQLLLLALQTLVAEGKLLPDLVKLHWFTRTKTTGVTRVRSADVDDAGAFGDWPEDFGDVEMSIERRYLDAAEKVWKGRM